jgi:hypothetical protein
MEQVLPEAVLQQVEALALVGVAILDMDALGEGDEVAVVDWEVVFAVVLDELFRLTRNAPGSKLKPKIWKMRLGI